MTASNDEQRAYWNGPGGARWVEARDRLERNMAAISEALFAAAAARPGERILDVGCGCGGTTAALHARTGGATLGVDISQPMLEQAQALVRPGLAFVHGDASQLPFAGDRDLVFSRFGVMFFADPVGAFTHLRTALAPGGRMVFACWRALALNPWAQLPLAAAEGLVPAPPPAEPHAPGPFAFGDGERLANILARAGFASVALQPLASVMHMGATLDEAALEATTIGPLARLTAEASADTLAALRSRIVDAYRPFVTPNGVEPAAAVWLVTAL